MSWITYLQRLVEASIVKRSGPVKAAGMNRLVGALCVVCSVAYITATILPTSELRLQVRDGGHTSLALNVSAVSLSNFKACYAKTYCVSQCLTSCSQCPKSHCIPTVGQRLP